MLKRLSKCLGFVNPTEVCGGQKFGGKYNNTIKERQKATLKKGLTRRVIAKLPALVVRSACQANVQGYKVGSNAISDIIVINVSDFTTPQHLTTLHGRKHPGSETTPMIIHVWLGREAKGLYIMGLEVTQVWPGRT